MNTTTAIADDYFQSDLSWLEEGVEFLTPSLGSTAPMRSSPRILENVVLGSIGIECLDLVIGSGSNSEKIRYKFSEEHRRRQTLRQLGHTVSAETRKKISLALMGRKSTPEANAKRSAKSKLYRHSDEAKAKIAAANRGKIVSAETRAKMRANHQARKAAGYVPRPFTDEERAKIGAAHRGKVVSEETRAKLRAHNLGKKKGIPKSPETIARMKEAAKRRWAAAKGIQVSVNPAPTATMLGTRLAQSQEKLEVEGD